VKATAPRSSASRRRWALWSRSARSLVFLVLVFLVFLFVLFLPLLLLLVLLVVLLVLLVLILGGGGPSLSGGVAEGVFGGARACRGQAFFPLLLGLFLGMADAVGPGLGV